MTVHYLFNLSKFILLCNRIKHIHDLKINPLFLVPFTPDVGKENGKGGGKGGSNSLAGLRFHLGLAAHKELLAKCDYLKM